MAMRHILDQIPLYPRLALKNETKINHLPYFTPKPGDSVFLPVGTVHALGGDIVVFEVQQNSDVTFRIYDWGHVDVKTGRHRALQINQALACIDFSQGAIGPVVPDLEAETPEVRERLFYCEYFYLWRLKGKSPFVVGKTGTLSVVVGITGAGQLEYDGVSYAIDKGDVLLLPVVVGACAFRPCGAVTLLEISIPE